MGDLSGALIFWPETTEDSRVRDVITMINKDGGPIASKYIGIPQSIVSRKGNMSIHLSIEHTPVKWSEKPEPTVDFVEETKTDTSLARGECHIHRPPPDRHTSKLVMDYINQITNCPCNVDFVNENNPLCATTDTFDIVRHRRPMNFVPETRSPCVLVERDGGQYQLARLTGQNDRKSRYLQKSPTSLLMCLPSVFLLGVPKCGTTSLHASLSFHQSISETQRKEMSFWNGGGFWEEDSFMDDNNNTRYNMFAYMSLAEEISKTMSKNIRTKLEDGRGTTNQVLDDTLILDSSPANFNSKLATKLAGFIPNVKAILIMREPTDRLFSYYRFSADVPARQNLPSFLDQTPQGFHKYVTNSLAKSEHPFSSGIYFTHASRLLETIPKKDMIFIQYEEFVKDPVAVIEEYILPVLGLEPYSSANRARVLHNERINTSKHKYQMLPETRTILQNYFSPYNQQLSELLNDSKWNWGY